MDDNKIVEIKALDGVDYSVEEITVIQWYKDIGDVVNVGDMLLCIDVSKTEIDIRSPVAGKLHKRCLHPGQTGPRGVTLALISTNIDSDVQEIEEKVVIDSKVIEKSVTVVDAVPAVQSQFTSVSDAARRFANEHKIDLTKIKPSGLHGTVIVKQDIVSFIEKSSTVIGMPAPKSSETGTYKLSSKRREEAKLLFRSITNIPHAETKMLISLAQLIKFAKHLNVSPTAVIAYAALYLLKDSRFNYFNDYVETDNKTVVSHSKIGLGIAVARPYEQGLAVVVLKDVEEQKFIHFFDKFRNSLFKVRDNKLAIDDFKGLTFTVNNTGTPCHLDLGRYTSNTGMCADYTGSSIIPWAIEDHATSAILSFGGFGVDNLRTTIFSLVFDHRLIDGINVTGNKLGAIEFLSGLKTLLESGQFLNDVTR